MNSKFSKPFTFDRVVRLTIGTIITIFILLTLKYLQDVLLPFFIAWLLAYIIYPMVIFVQKKLKVRYRTPSILIVLTTIIGVIATATAIFIPRIISEFFKLKDIIIKYTSTKNSGIFPQSWENFLQSFFKEINISEIVNYDSISSLVKDIFPHAWKILSSSISITMGAIMAIIVLLYLFFILKDYHKITKEMISFVPSRHRAFAFDLTKDMEQSMNQYFRGQSLIAFIVGLLFCIGFSIIGMPLAIVMGLLIGALNLIPYMQTLGIPPAILLMLLHVAETGGSVWNNLITLAAVFVIVQIIQDGYLVPKIMGKTTGLNPAFILLSLSIWGYVLGVLGMIIALPATTLIISYYKRFVLSEQEVINDNTTSYT